MGGTTNWDMVRLYGTMSPLQRQSLVEGRRMNFRTLTSDQGEYVRRMLFGTGTHLSAAQEGKPEAQDEFDIAMGSLNNLAVDYRTEPTEVMPNGVPAAGWLDLKATDGFVVSPVTADGTTTGAMGALGPDALAIFKYFSEDPKLAQVATMLPKLDKVRRGKRVTLNYAFHVATGVSSHEVLHDDKLDKSGPILSLDSLPDDDKKQLAEWLDRIKKSPLSAIGAMMGGARQIPPQ